MLLQLKSLGPKPLKAVDIYLKKPEEERKPCIFVLDSLGMLSTEKEIKDALDDKQVRDMTKSQLVKGAFRMLTLKLGQANIPMIVTNHLTMLLGLMYLQKKWGRQWSQVCSKFNHLSQQEKRKDGTEIVGNIIKV